MIFLVYCYKCEFIRLCLSIIALFDFLFADEMKSDQGTDQETGNIVPCNPVTPAGTFSSDSGFPPVEGVPAGVTHRPQPIRLSKPSIDLDMETSGKASHLPGSGLGLAQSNSRLPTAVTLTANSEKPSLESTGSSPRRDFVTLSRQGTSSTSINDNKQSAKDLSSDFSKAGSLISSGYGDSSAFKAIGNKVQIIPNGVSGGQCDSMMLGTFGRGGNFDVRQFMSVMNGGDTFSELKRNFPEGYGMVSPNITKVANGFSSQFVQVHAATSMSGVQSAPAPVHSVHAPVQLLQRSVQSQQLPVHSVQALVHSVQAPVHSSVQAPVHSVQLLQSAVRFPVQSIGSESGMESPGFFLRSPLPVQYLVPSILLSLPASSSKQSATSTPLLPYSPIPRTMQTPNSGLAVMDTMPTSPFFVLQGQPRLSTWLSNQAASPAPRSPLVVTSSMHLHDPLR